MAFLFACPFRTRKVSSRGRLWQLPIAKTATDKHEEQITPPYETLPFAHPAASQEDLNTANFPASIHMTGGGAG